jgi:anhydro-N-acetylmuramic acid kinase
MDYEDTLTAPSKGPWIVIGLMSGTSLDGLDVAVCEFDVDKDYSNWRGEIAYYQCFKYPLELTIRLRESMDMKSEKLYQLDRDWARFAASCVNTLNTKAHLLSSHGHTVFHNPSDGYTVQIGSGADLAALTSLPVVCDLRRLDVAYGGQGAPLVPKADSVLFSKYSACLNLGGFANISHLKSSQDTTAWDIGVCNNLLNKLSSEKGFEYDDGGSIASSGKLIPELLKEFMALPYHKLPAPKSLGIEWMKFEILPILNKYKHLPLEDRMCTAVEYISLTIINSCPSSGKILVTGGGVLNAYLMSSLNELSANASFEFVTPELNMIHGKEAFAFAFLGLLRVLNKPNTLQSVTGASKSSSSGALWLPNR